MLRNSEQLCHLLPRLEFDYTGLTLQCNVISHKIDIAHEASRGEAAILRGEAAQDEAHWKSPTKPGCEFVSVVHGEMDRFHLAKKQIGNKAKNAKVTTIRLVAGTVKVM